MTDYKVGKITHYFDKIRVAVLELTDGIAKGDKIKIVGPDNEVEMVVDSMQVEHQQITEAKKGDTIGMKVAGAVNEGDEVFKVG